MSENELSITQNSFSNLKDFNMAEALKSELDGLDTSFERIKMPSAGSTIFEIQEDSDDENETIKDFTAVILYHEPYRAFYNDKYSGGNQPPDCGSFDGINGEGVPGGECEKCEFNRFGSAENGGKACKDRRRIYLLREHEIFPLMLSLPTGSLKNFSQYIKKLLSKGIKSNNVLTKFSLKKALNTNGMPYSQAQFSLARVLNTEEYETINILSEQIKIHNLKSSFITEEHDK